VVAVFQLRRCGGEDALEGSLKGDHNGGEHHDVEYNDDGEFQTFHV
jgi:hypothetical protein